VAERIDRAWLKEHGGKKLAFHADASDRAIWHYRCIDRRDGAPIGLFKTETLFRKQKSNGDRAGTVVTSWTVDDCETEFDDLEAALDALKAVREAVVG